MFLVNTKKCLKIFSRTFVSSDDDWILDRAEEVGAIPIKRPQELCGDTPNIPVYRHALQFMNGVDNIVAIQVNSPTLDTRLIYNVKSIIEKYRFNEIMTCHEDYSIYGSIWALSRKRLLEYKNFYNPKPDILLLDTSVDIHTKSDLEKALCQRYSL